MWPISVVIGGVGVCECVCLASGEHKAELLFIRLQKSGCVLCCFCRLYVCSSASISLFIPRSLSCGMVWSVSVWACVDLFCQGYTLGQNPLFGLYHLTYKPLFFLTFLKHKNEHTLPFTHMLSLSLSLPTNTSPSCSWYPRQEAKLTWPLILDHLCHVFFQTMWLKQGVSDWQLQYFETLSPNLDALNMQP